MCTKFSDMIVGPFPFAIRSFGMLAFCFVFFFVLFFFCFSMLVLFSFFVMSHVHTITEMLHGVSSTLPQNVIKYRIPEVVQ